MTNQPPSAARKLTLAAAVGAVYAVLTVALPVPQYGPLQIRFAEALTVLPFLFPAAVPGLFTGCLIANMLSPYGLPDMIVGSAATLIAALWTARMPGRWLAPLPPVLCNGVLVGGMIAWYEAGFGPNFLKMFAFHSLTLAAGELLACYLLGSILLTAFSRISFFRGMIPPERLK
jgi:uncharacterized membrane protein